MLRYCVVAVIALGGLGCSSPTAVERDAEGWVRTVGRIDAAVSSVPLLMFDPQTARAGRDVVATISTYGEAGCLRRGDTTVSAKGQVVTITPHDYVAPRGTSCGVGVQRVSRDVLLRFDRVGRATVYIRGRDAHGRSTTATYRLDVVS